MASERQFGTATLLMVDQVSSTDQLERLGQQEAMRVRSGLLDRLIQAVRANGGEVVDTTGDGLFAHFTSATQGLASAMQMMAENELANTTAADDAVRCQLRVGVHTGEPSVDTSGRLHGVPVVVASRLCTAAGAGQILVSDITRLLAASGELEFTQPESLSLKGLSEPVGASTLSWAVALDRLAPRPVRRILIDDDEDFPFAGRHAEQHLLARAWERAATSQRQVVALSGEPGLGKTRIALELLRTVLEEGALVAVGRCDEDLPVPFGCFIEPIRAVLDALSNSVDASGEDLPLDALAPVLPLSRTGISPQIDPVSAKFQLFEAVTRVFEMAARESPVCVLFDDIQWATPDSLALLRHLIRTSRSTRLLVLLTHRSNELTNQTPLFGFLADLHREAGTQQVELSDLSTEDVAELASAAAGHALAEEELVVARFVAERCRGSALFVTEMLRHFIQSGAVVNDGGRWRMASPTSFSDIPLSVRDVITRRLARFGDDVQTTIGTAAIIGYQFDVELLARLLERSEDTVLDHLEALVDAQLLSALPGDSFEFRHALTRETLLERHSPARLSRMHKRIAETIEQCGRADTHIEELAYHWSEAVGLTDAVRVVHYCSQAADIAMERRAYADAATLYERALAAQVVVAPSATGEQTSLLISLGRAQRLAGNVHARSTLEQAFEKGRSNGDGSAMAEALILMLRPVGFFLDSGKSDEVLLAMIEEALPYLEGSDRARALAARASERHWVVGPVVLSREIDEALELARKGAAPRALAEVLNTSCVALGGPDYAHRRLDWCREARMIANEHGFVDVAANAEFIDVMTSYELGDPEAIAGLASLREQSGLSNGVLVWFVSLFTAMRQSMIDPVAAEVLATEAYQCGEALGEPEAFDGFGMQLSDSYWHQGRLDEIVDVYRQVALDRPAMPGLRSGYGRVLLELNDREGAATEFAFLAMLGFDVAHDMGWYGTVADTAVLAVEFGTDDQRREIYDLLAPMAGRHAISLWFVVCNGSIDRHLGMLAESLGDLETARAHFEDAHALESAFGHDVWLARLAQDRARVASALAGKLNPAEQRRQS